MGEWYWIGVAVGLGAGVGVVLAGILGGNWRQVGLAALVAAGGGAAIGFGLDDWDEAVGGAVGGLAGTAGAGQLVLGALRRGGTRAGTALLLAGGAIAVAALAWVPGVGYAEAALLPALGLRLRRRSSGRFAGLRILARD